MWHDFWIYAFIAMSILILIEKYGNIKIHNRTVMNEKNYRKTNLVQNITFIKITWKLYFIYHTFSGTSRHFSFVNTSIDVIFSIRHFVLWWSIGNQNLGFFVDPGLSIHVLSRKFLTISIIFVWSSLHDVMHAINISIPEQLKHWWTENLKVYLLAPTWMKIINIILISI